MRLLISLAFCLVVVGASRADDIQIFNSRNMKIPVCVHSDRRDEIKEIRLYVSSDKGKTWRKTSTVAPDQEFFMFTAPKDGVYWFSLQVLSKNKRADPLDTASLAPHQKVVIQTTSKAPPILDSAKTAAEEIVALRAKVEELEQQLSLEEEITALRARVEKLERRIAGLRARKRKQP